MKTYYVAPVISSLALAILAGGMLQTRLDSPEAAAREFTRAAAQGDPVKLGERTCAEVKAQAEAASPAQSAFSMLGESLDSPELSIADFDLRFTRMAAVTDTATVSVSGQSRSGANPSARLEETWSLLKEGGEWKYCGEALVPQADLGGLLLQPSEVEFPLIDSEDTLADLLSAYPQTYAEFRRAGAQGAVLKEYTLEGKWIDSFAFWFPSYGAASKGSLVFADFLRSITRTNQPTVPADGLGTEGAAFAVTSPPDYELYAYVWRTGNVVLALGIRAKPGELKQSDAKEWADKMQSHLR